MADRCERVFLYSSESERSHVSSGEPDWEHIAPAPAVYAAPASAVDLAPAPAVYAVPAPGVEYIAPAPAVERQSPDVAPVVEYSAPAPAVLCPSPVVEYIAPATPISRPAPVVEYIAASCVIATCTECSISSKCASSFHGSSHREVLRDRAARQGCLFRQMKRGDTQPVAELTSLGKACEVARGSPVASLLVPVAMREQRLSSKLLAFEKLELERQVAVLELGENFQRLTDLVNEGKGAGAGTAVGGVGA